jgi:predicted nucleic-acid-binding Zn-ribbon protein
MAPPDTPDDDETEYPFVRCASCGAKAAPSWSYCRSCQSSLDDARPPKDGLEKVGADDTLDMEEAGCPKCGHEEATVDEVATTGMGLTRLFDLQNRRFQVVTCTNCGYTEFYRGHDADVIVDLFLGG